jgi:serine protease Do
MRISKLSPRGARGALLAVLLSTTALAGFAAGHAGFADATQPAPIQPTAPAQALPDFSALVSQVKPAVVSITSEMKAEMANDEMGPQSPVPFPFGRMMPRMPQGHVEARGSGFIVDPDGTIVTNNHVVADAKSVSVTLDDGTVLPAKVVGRDSRTDLAVLHVNAGHPLPYIQLGDSDHVKASAAPSPPESCPPVGATSAPALMTASCRSTRRSTAATPAGRCSRRTGAWSA